MKTYNYTRRDFLKTLGVGAATLSSQKTLFAAGDTDDNKTRPNIVILFVDDMGYSDVGCFGGEIDTPNLDKLAANGLRLTQFYNSARCCPSRASLLTGLYPHQAGVGMMVYKNYGKGYLGNLNDECVTFGQVASSAGYQTMLVGKWHSGNKPDSRPEVRGFNRFTGIYSHIDSYWKVLKTCDIYRDGKMFIPAGQNPVNPYNLTQEFYTTDFFTDTAIDYIDRALQDKSKPFLLHACYNVPHFPLEAPDDLIEKYRGRYMKGWDKLRQDKLERMKAMGIVSQNQKLPRVKGFVNRNIPGFTTTGVETDYLPKWDSLSKKDKHELDFRRAIYAAQIDRFDQNVGRIVTHLKKRGIFDNTLILFFSDNGCSGELGNFGMNWKKNTTANYSQWRKAGGWSISQGQCWASYSNAPLRKYKKFVHEGGIASPFIAHWPNGIKNTGQIYDKQMFHLIDVMPTLCEIAGAKYPKTHNGKNIIPAQGINMFPFITGTDAQIEPRTLYWQHESHAADDRNENAWELYNLSKDRSETENIIKEHPEIARRLKQKWLEWARQVNVIPYPEDRRR